MSAHTRIHVHKHSCMCSQETEMEAEGRGWEKAGDGGGGAEERREGGMKIGESRGRNIGKQYLLHHQFEYLYNVYLNMYVSPYKNL